MRITFDRVLNVLLLVAVGYVLIGVPRAKPARACPKFDVGDAVPAIAGLPYEAADRTVVLFVRSTCHYCTESAPCYRELVKGGAKLVAISLEPKTSLDDYLRAQGLAIESATVDRTAWPKLSGTPTMIVVDRTGHVVASWLGMLPAAEQQRARSLLLTKG